MSHNVNLPPPSAAHLNGDSKFEAFKQSLQIKGRVLYNREQPDKDRSIEASWIEALARDGVVSGHIQIRYAIIRGNLNLKYATFKGRVAITESTFLGEVNLSFTKFECGISLKASRFEQKADFRAAHSTGDFSMPLACFNKHAVFEDIHVDEVFSAEGALFKRASFMRAHFSKSAMFSGALVAGRKLVQTRFQDDADFSDAHFKGPAYFKGVCFEKEATFDRIRIESSGFFDCDSLEDPQIIHKRHQVRETTIGREGQELLQPEYGGQVNFIGARIDNSATFAGTHFKDGVDFRRIQIAGTAIFDPYIISKDEPPDVFLPVCFDKDADFWNADIKGAAQFTSARFGGEANFKHMRVGRGAYFRATVYNDKLHRAVFAGETSFLGADINGSLVCSGARFIRDVRFIGIHVTGVLEFVPIIYNDHLCPVLFNGNVSFLDAYVKGSLNFDGAVFNMGASFERVITDGSAFFRVAKYDIEADGKYSAAAQDDKLFVEENERTGRLIPAEFFGAAWFVGARIKGSAEFDGAQFHGEASFEHMQVSTDVYFRPWEVHATPARFFNKANFIGMNVKGMAEFSGTVFDMLADFTGMQIGGNAYFDSQHHYDEKDGRDYRDKKRKISPVCFHGDVQFNGAVFRNEVDFKGTQFVRKAGVPDSKAKKLKADFTGARSEGPVYFYEAKFGGDTIFREARFTSLFFDPPSPRKKGWIKTRIDKLRGKPPAPQKESQFVGDVDMGGCFYERIEVELEHLLSKMKTVPGSYDTEEEASPNVASKTYEEYNRQPYTHLIKALRSVGDDRTANEVYVKQRHIERKNIWKGFTESLTGLRPLDTILSIGNYGIDWLFWHLGKYGVQPERLFVISAVIIVLGMMIFAQPYAVRTKSAEREPPKGVVAYLKNGEGRQEIEMREGAGEANDLRPMDALRFSISQFIPIVDIPSGSKWRINENGYFKFRDSEAVQFPYDLYGSIHRVLGAILVPLLIASLAGALYRRFQKDL